MPASWGRINPLRILAKSSQQTSAESSQNADSRWSIKSSSTSSSTSSSSCSSSKRSSSNTTASNHNNRDSEEHRITIRDEDLDLLGEVAMSAMVSPPGTKIDENASSMRTVNAKLTSKALIWGLHCLRLDDIVAVSYSDGSRRFTVHSYAHKKPGWMPSTLVRSRRKRTDLQFLASNSEEVVQWVSAFAEQGCYINYSRHPLSSSKRKGSVVDAGSSPSPSMKCKSRPNVMVILNPRSGRGRARKVFSKAEAVLKLAGFKLSVVETTSARHAQNLASTVDLSTCPDGIVCVGGDGIINEVLNGLLSREDAQQASQVPIGIIPAGSDNSLVWTVLGISDPISAAVAIVKGGMVGMDVFGVEWTKTGAVHHGLTIAYYGFMSDVLELSAKYQKRFGPLRYFVAGALKLLRLPQYKCEVEYVPAGEGNRDVASAVEVCSLENEGTGIFSERSTDQLESGTRTNLEALFSRITIDPADSDYVRGLDAKKKKQQHRLQQSFSQGGTEEALAVHHPLPGATSPSPRPRTRSRSRTERSWSGLSVDGDGTRLSRSSPVMLSDGDNAYIMGPPKWDCDGLEPSNDSLAAAAAALPAPAPKWEIRQGPILGVMVCNHQCKTVQSLPSQVLAPAAEHDDGALDLMIVRGAGRLQLLRFFWLMQFNRHIKLPFVEYVKVREVVLKTGSNAHQGCGVDGELLTLNGPISATLLPYRCRLIGRARQPEHQGQQQQLQQQQQQQQQQQHQSC